MRRIFSGGLALALLLSLSGCGRAETPESVQIIAMDTVMTFTAYGEEAAEAVTDMSAEVRRLDKLLSRTDEEGEVYRLNELGEAAVDQEVWDLIGTAGTYTQATGGAFDITIAPVASAWGFTTDAYRVPAKAELDGLLSLVGMEHIHGGETAADGQVEVSLDTDCRIDLGAIGKGYGSDRVAEILREHGVSRAVAALGGNVLVLGTRPDGKAWQVGVKDPAKPEDAEACLGILSLTDAYAVTSGSYERYFEENGKRYHHIIDPATGCPAESGLVSVTVVADAVTGNGTMCDALSTALFVMGAEKAADFWRSGVYDFQMVLVTEDGRVLVTEGLADRFTLEGEDYAYETVS